MRRKLCVGLLAILPFVLTGAEASPAHAQALICNGTGCLQEPSYYCHTSAVLNQYTTDHSRQDGIAALPAFFTFSTTYFAHHRAELVMQCSKDMGWGQALNGSWGGPNQVTDFYQDVCVGSNSPESPTCMDDRGFEFSSATRNFQSISEDNAQPCQLTGPPFPGSTECTTSLLYYYSISATWEGEGIDGTQGEMGGCSPSSNCDGFNNEGF